MWSAVSNEKGFLLKRKEKERQKVEKALISCDILYFFRSLLPPLPQVLYFICMNYLTLPLVLWYAFWGMCFGVFRAQIAFHFCVPLFHSLCFGGWQLSIWSGILSFGHTGINARQESFQFKETHLYLGPGFSVRNIFLPVAMCFSPFRWFRVMLQLTSGFTCRAKWLDRVRGRSRKRAR